MTRLLKRPRFASVVLDVDSTLAAIEGVDWLAALRSDAVASACADLTTRAMAGEMPLEEVYELRLRAIAPTVGEIAALGEAYRHAVEPGARALIDALREVGCEVHMVSGGLRSASSPASSSARALPITSASVSVPRSRSRWRRRSARTAMCRPAWATPWSSSRAATAAG